MSNEFQQSLVQRTGMALAAVILLAIVNMVASYLTAESSENDAVRINIAGSLRMQAHRIATEYILTATQSSLGDRNALARRIQEFDQRLQLPVLAVRIRNSSNRTLVDAFSLVEQGWIRLKPLLLAQGTATPQIRQQIDLFVGDIDAMVKALELQTESKFRVLRVIQGASLIMTVCLAGMMFLNVYNYVVGPLHQLIEMAGKLRAGDFSMRLDSKSDDELTVLAHTFNDMAASLDGMYRTLEEQVKSKTRHLEETQTMLRFLYDASRLLGAEGNIVNKLERTMDHLRREIDMVGGEIRLHYASPDDPFLIGSQTDSNLFSHSRGETGSATGHQLKSYRLQHDNREYGCLNITLAEHDGISAEQHLMLTSLADTIGAALANETRKDQEHRMALIEERTAIARELHDSIAQSLSFTKIQVSRFQSLLAQDAHRDMLENVLLEIRAGIQSAYAQLRELLTTFRLQLDSPGLQASLLATAKEFEDKGKISISVESSLQNYPLTPNEEIHILQIVREALSNVLRHSGADRASIRLGLDRDGGMIEVHISDNGRGLGRPDPGRNHYGQTIMRERAAILGGLVEFGDTAAGGAEVILRFLAEHALSSNADQQKPDNLIESGGTQHDTHSTR